MPYQPGFTSLQRKAVLRRQRLAVHFIDQQNLGPGRFFDGQTALVVLHLIAFDAAIQTGKNNFRGSAVDAGFLQDGSKRRAGPLGGADGFEKPRLADAPRRK